MRRKIRGEILRRTTRDDKVQLQVQCDGFRDLKDPKETKTNIEENKGSQKMATRRATIGANKWRESNSNFETTGTV